MIRNALVGIAALAAGVVPLASMGGAGQAFGQASTLRWEGFNPDDPIGSSAIRLEQLVREKCFRGPQMVTIGFSRFGNETTGLTPDQELNLMSALHAAFSRLPNVRVAPFADIAGVLALQQAGLTATDQAGDIEQQLARVQLVVQPLGQMVGRSFNLSLKTIDRTGGKCYEAVDAVAVPSHLVGETYVDVRGLFTQTMRLLRDRARGVNQVAVRGAGDALAPHLPDYFVREMRQAVSDTEGQGTQVIGRETKIEVTPGSALPRANATYWDAEVAVLQHQSGYRIMVDVTRPEESPIARQGLVRPESLPPLPRNRFVVQGGQRGGNAVLQLRPTSLRVADSVNDRTPSQRYAFSLTQASFVEIDVPEVNGRDVPINPVMLGPGGTVLGAINPPGARPNLRRYRLDAGQYEIGVAAPSRGSHSFTLAARAVPVSEMLMPEPPRGSRLTRQFQDWTVGEMGAGRDKRCFAFTPALSVSPEGWREQAPVIQLAVTSERGGELSHFLDLAERFATGEPLSVRITDGRSEQAMQVAALGRHIAPVQQGRDGAPILDPDAIRGYTRGLQLELSGTTSDGRPARIVYSLAGYRSAASAMAMGCNRLDFARSLIWQ